MILPVYTKKVNSNVFTPIGSWEFTKGWYNDGKNQYMAQFEYVKQICTLNEHFYRFPLYGITQTDRYYWLKLNFWEFLHFECVQGRIWESIISIITHIIKFLFSIFK